MSAADTPDNETCEQCEQQFPLPNDRPNHCSELCYYRDKGVAIINQVESEAPICSTCYGVVRDVEPIPDTVYKNADGFQFPTPLTTHGVDDFSDEISQRIEGTRWSCECGAVDPSDRHGLVQETDLKTTAVNFVHAMRSLYEKGAILHAPDEHVFADAIREGHTDLAYAAGRAVYG